MQPLTTDNKRISQVGKKAIFDEINEAVPIAYRNCDYKIPAIKDEAERKIYSDLINWLADYAFTYLPGYRVGELKRAIDLGSAGHYGEFYGLNKKSFVKFLSDHQKANAFNTTASIMSNSSGATQAYRPDADTQFNTLKDLTVRAYVNFKEGKVVSGYSIIYGFLTGISLLNVSQEEKVVLYTEAEAFVSSLKRTDTGAQMRDFIRQALTQSAIDKKAEVIDRAKQKAVIKYFTNLTGDIDSIIEGGRLSFKANCK